MRKLTKSCLFQQVERLILCKTIQERNDNQATETISNTSGRI